MLETSDRLHLEEQVENLIEDKLQEKFEVQDSLLQTFIPFLTFKQNSDQQSLEVLYQLFQKNFFQQSLDSLTCLNMLISDHILKPTVKVWHPS